MRAVRTKTSAALNRCSTFPPLLSLSLCLRRTKPQCAATAVRAGSAPPRSVPPLRLARPSSLPRPRQHARYRPSLRWQRRLIATHRAAPSRTRARPAPERSAHSILPPGATLPPSSRRRLRRCSRPTPTRVPTLRHCLSSKVSFHRRSTSTTKRGSFSALCRSSLAVQVPQWPSMAGRGRRRSSRSGEGAKDATKAA